MSALARHMIAMLGLHSCDVLLLLVLVLVLVLRLVLVLVLRLVGDWHAALCLGALLLTRMHTATCYIFILSAVGNASIEVHLDCCLRHFLGEGEVHGFFVADHGQLLARPAASLSCRCRHTTSLVNDLISLLIQDASKVDVELREDVDNAYNAEFELDLRLPCA